jgi:flagellar biosynthetic protein FliQ
MKLAGPPLLAALGAGIIVSVFQAVTQIKEATLVFLPKAAALFAVLMILGPSMMLALDNFTHFIFNQIILAGGS